MSERPARCSDDELREFVVGWCDGRIFCSAELPTPDLLGSVFMPLALGALQEWTREEIGLIGVVWEYRREAGPLAVNGQPVFFSCRLMHRDDWERARRAIDRELERRRTIEL